MNFKFIELVKALAKVVLPVPGRSSISICPPLKIVANDLENIVAGSSVIRLDPNASQEEIEKKKELIMEDVNQILDSSNFQNEGVYVKASTLGSLEAFLTLLKEIYMVVSDHYNHL